MWSDAVISHTGSQSPLFAVVRWSVRVRTPPRGSDRGQKYGLVPVLRNSPTGSVLRQQKGGYDLGGSLSGRGFDVLRYKTECEWKGA